MIFVDTGAWVAQFSKRDQYYQKGAGIFRKLQKERARLATSGPVLYETITFLTREVSPATAIRAGRQILGWESLFILRPDASDETAALAFMEKFAEHPIGFVDCLSFALMRRHHIPDAFTFDRHFELAGYQLVV